MLSGQGLAIVKFLSYEKSKLNEAILCKYITSGFKIIVSVSVPVIILIGIFSSFFTKIFFNNSDYQQLLLPMLFFALSMSVSTYIISVFRGLGQFAIFNGIQIASQVVILLNFIINKQQNVKQVLVIWGFITILIPMIIVLIQCFLKKDIIQIKTDKKITKKLLKYGIPRTPGEFIQFSYYLIPLIIVNKKFGGVQVSLFSASTGILQLFLPFFSYIGLILLPHTSSAISKGKFQEIKKKIDKGAIIYLLISLFFVFVGLLITPFLIKILYSSDFLLGTTTARVLLISLIPRSLFLLLRNPIDAISNKPYNTYNLFISFIIMMIMMQIVVSPVGIAISFVVSDVVLCLLSLLIWKYSHKIIEREEKINEKI